MSKQPYISVIIPTYNRAAYLADAITSVAEQKKARWPYEIIVVDDGSTDNTPQVIQALKHKVRYIRLPHNSGLPAVARNRGAAVAKGTLLAFQDSDDRWSPDKLASQVPAFDDPKVVLAYANAQICDADGAPVGTTVITADQAHSGKVFEALLQNNFVSTLTVMVRKKAFDKAGGFNENKRLRGIEDYHLWLRLATLGSFVYINKSLAFYRRHPDNISPKQLADSLKLLRAAYSLLARDLPHHKPLIHKRLYALTQDLVRISKHPKRILYMLQSVAHRKSMS